MKTVVFIFLFNTHNKVEVEIFVSDPYFVYVILDVLSTSGKTYAVYIYIVWH